MEIKLVSSPSEPQVHGNGELQGATNTPRKLFTRLLQEEKGTNLQATQVGITSVSFRGRNHKMSAVMQQCASQQNFYGRSYYISASSALAGDASPSEYNEEERHVRELQLHDRMCNPIAFHAEMIGDMMYFHQSLATLYKML